MTIVSDLEHELLKEPTWAFLKRLCPPDMKGVWGLRWNEKEFSFGPASDAWMIVCTIEEIEEMVSELSELFADEEIRFLYDTEVCGAQSWPYYTVEADPEQRYMRKEDNESLSKPH